MSSFEDFCDVPPACYPNIIDGKYQITGRVYLLAGAAVDPIPECSSSVMDVPVPYNHTYIKQRVQSVLSNLQLCVKYSAQKLKPKRQKNSNKLGMPVTKPLACILKPKI
uniref:Uncharacterized protein n=1 Tax=Romanomermis culicivorax TaxID=13658 RepID=A0A915JL49_ROMCU